MGDDDDAAVIARSCAEPGAFGQIFDRHATVLHRYVVRRLGPNEAEQLVAEVFRIAFEKRARFDLDRTSARPWLYGIATNLIARHRRTEARRITATAKLAASRLEPPDVVERVDDAFDAAATWERVATALNELREPERDVLLLHAWEGLAYDEIAVALDLPIGTVRSRLHRARAHLRELTGLTGREDVDDDCRDTGRIRS